jgi:glutamine cyclotransferase
MLLALGACARPSYDLKASARVAARGRPLRWQLVSVLRHPSDSYTEGLVFDGDRLFESAGWAGESRLLELDPQTGQTIREIHWPSRIGTGSPVPYAEGLAVADGRLVQLSWKNQLALTWDVRSLVRGADLAYRGDGWGLCFDGREFLRSDGTATLHRHEPQSFEENPASVTVQALDGVGNVNELECVADNLYANVWRTPFVVRVDVNTGELTGVLDFSALIADAAASGKESVLNGIAYRPSTQEMYVTGKRWAKMYVIKVVD